jgi:hypothetical protein
MVGATVGGGGGGTGVFLNRFTSTNERLAASGSSTVTMTANTDGTLTVVGNGTAIDGDITPNPGYYSPTTALIGSNYQMRITPTAGSFSTGAVNTWVLMSPALPTNAWTVVANSTTTTKSVTFTIEVRDIFTATVLATTTGNVIDCEFVQT